MATKCNHEDSRLTCIDCSTPLCSNCLVQCPVGFRCKSCIGSLKGSRSSTPRMLVARTLLMFIGIGFGAGWLMPFIAIPYISCIICYFLGLFIGRGMNKVLDQKLGGNVTKIIVFGLLIGMSLSPLGFLPYFMFVALQSSIMDGGSIFGALTSVVCSLFCPGLFIVGMLRATVWGERWY